MTTKKSKPIYLLYECDAWKTHSSKALIMATTSKRKLNAQICKELRKKRMSFAGKTGQTGVSDFTSFIYAHAYNYLGNGIVEVVKDGEALY